MNTRKESPAAPGTDSHASAASGEAGADAVRTAYSGFPVVALGASAGGLEAFEQFLHAMPPDSGMGFVLVQHLDPTHASILSEILQRNTPMPVVEARNQMPIERNHCSSVTWGKSR